MKNFIKSWMDRPSGPTLWLGTLCSALANQLATAWLNQSQAASRLPVPYWEAQLSFSPELLRDWYGQLLQQGTLDTYVRTQHIDFLFIASTLALHFLALMAVSRLFAARSALRRGLVVAACLSTIAPLADAAENLVCYAMLARPLDFPPVWSYVYSGFAAVKFAFFAFAYLVAATAIVAAAGLSAKARLTVWRRGRHSAG